MEDSIWGNFYKALTFSEDKDVLSPKEYGFYLYKKGKVRNGRKSKSRK